TSLVNGMTADFETANSNMAYFSALLSGELSSDSPFPSAQAMSNGNMSPQLVSNVTNVEDIWGTSNRARFNAENGLERIRDILGDDFKLSSQAVRAYIWAGFTNRQLGENYCYAVFDGGSKQPFTDYFERAREQFTKAIDLAKQQNADEMLLDRAHSGRA